MSSTVDDVMTISEAASYHGVSHQAIEYQCKKHWGPSGQARKAGRLRGTWLIDRSAVLAYTPDEGKKNA